MLVIQLLCLSSKCSLSTWLWFAGADGQRLPSLCRLALGWVRQQGALQESRLSAAGRRDSVPGAGSLSLPARLSIPAAAAGSSPHAVPQSTKGQIQRPQVPPPADQRPSSAAWVLIQSELPFKLLILTQPLPWVPQPPGQTTAASYIYNLLPQCSSLAFSVSNT